MTESRTRGVIMAGLVGVCFLWLSALHGCGNSAGEIDKETGKVQLAPVLNAAPGVVPLDQEGPSQAPE